MRKLIAIEFITMDGVIQGPGGPQEDITGGFDLGGWIGPYSDPTLSANIRKQMSLPFDLLLGRFTFEIWEPYWPNNVSIWPGADRATKYVASTTRTEGNWHPAVFLNKDVVEQVRLIKLQDGPDLHLYGSANLLQTLLKHDLVDEFWLKIHPITFGKGKRLFVDGTIPAAFSISDHFVNSKGVISVNYVRAGAIPRED